MGVNDVRDYDVRELHPALLVLEALEAGLEGLSPLPDIADTVLSTRNDGREAFIVKMTDGTVWRFEAEQIEDPDLCPSCGESYKDAHAEDCPIWLDMQAEGV